jgi:hypothetical protein
MWQVDGQCASLFQEPKKISACYEAAFPTAGRQIVWADECLLLADTVAKVSKRWAMIFSAKT